MKALRAWPIIAILLLGIIYSSASAGWTPATRISDEALAHDPRIAANGDILHVAYWKVGGYTSAYYLRSVNCGEVWEEPFLLSDTANTSNSISPVIRISGEYVTAIWRYTAGPSSWNFGFRRSTDYGGTWSDNIVVLDTDSYQLEKHTYYLSNNSLFFIYSRWDQDLIVEFAASTDWGESWTEPSEVFRAQETGRIDMAARGDTVHFVWAGRFILGDKWDIYHIMSTDAGDSWSPNSILSTFDDRGSNYPSISINESGDIVVAWIDAKYTDSPFTADIFVRYSYDSGESWGEEEHLTIHHLAKTVRAFWSGDSIHLTWEDWRFDQRDIFYRLSTDNGVTWGEDQRIEDDPGESEYPDIAVTEGHVHLVWSDFRDDPGNGVYYSRWDDENPEIPVLSEWGMLILALLLLAVGTPAVVRARRKALRVERG